jgi:hypothetical protein
MSDYYQGVVAEYLRSDRGTFVNPEILLQLEPGASPKKGRFWYCDLMAISVRRKQAFLCEVTYSSSMSALIARLAAWKTHWAGLRVALDRDCGIDASWTLRPWIFLPQDRNPVYSRKLAKIGPLGPADMPVPKITFLEEVVPWKYCTWDRKPSGETLGVLGEG